MRKIYLGLLNCILLTSSCNLTNDHQEITETKIDTSIQVVSNLEIKTTKIDTLYRDFYYEDSLKYGLRFGMTLSKWNKQLANLANDKIIQELKEESTFESRPYSCSGSLKGFISIDKSQDINRSGQGYYILGLFTKPDIKIDTIELFRINKIPVKEPILIGIQIDFNMPASYIKDVMDAAIIRDNLKYMVGPQPMIVDDNPIAMENFTDVVAESMEKFANKSEGEHLNNKPVSRSTSTETVFVSEKFYSIIKVTREEGANVVRNSDYKIISMSNEYKTYKLSQILFSKKQFKLDIFNYMTAPQQENYKSTLKTKELIDKTLQ